MSVTFSPTWRASALGNNGIIANIATCAFTIPASAMTGDFARVVVAANTSSQTCSAPTGWRLISSGADTSGTVLRVYYFWKILAGTAGQISTEAGTTATFTWTATLITPGIMDVLYNVDQGSPFAFFAVPTNSTVTNTVLAGTTYTSNANNLIDYVYIGRTATTINTQPTVGATGTQEGFCSTAFAGAVNISLASAYETSVTTTRATVGGLSETYTNTNTNYIIYRVALNPGLATSANNYQFLRAGNGISLSERIR